MNCTSCDLAGQKRTLDSTTKQCLCIDKFFEDSVLLTCESCHHSCKKCTSGSAATQCTECNPTKNRVWDGSGSCNCLSHYYDDGSSETCALCNAKCLTCSGTDTTCTGCDTSLMRTYDSATNTCPCNPKFYDSGINMCQQCHYSCKLCSAGALSTDCTDCDSAKKRVSDGSGRCKCMDKFYDSGVELCSSCNVKCLTCQTTSTNCLTCHSSRSLDSTSKMCNCADGYGENSPVTESCRLLTCHVSCKTCKDTETICTSCESTNQRTLNAGLGQCPCNAKFYDTGIAACQSCDYTCKECSVSATNCTSCNALKFRVYDGNGNCPCMPKYYNSGNN